jgi:hypothetical protein
MVLEVLWHGIMGPEWHFDSADRVLQVRCMAGKAQGTFHPLLNSFHYDSSPLAVTLAIQ